MKKWSHDEIGLTTALVLLVSVVFGSMIIEELFIDREPEVIETVKIIEEPEELVIEWIYEPPEDRSLMALMEKYSGE